eukprot:CAMPEP_0119119160 /NCGR_PEP_ID=MMETSP1310-20130426/769_1 /TAXON_ID=464262 /ORGANISM="Genus nov. species nov., Strain RCC2339" /LENGTH=150 /DNA_ID=CAMNT_0007108577 /DNA_START=189 /DNA_END=641 /DNA_ORIENTATION=-
MAIGRSMGLGGLGQFALLVQAKVREVVVHAEADDGVATCRIFPVVRVAHDEIVRIRLLPDFLRIVPVLLPLGGGLGNDIMVVDDALDEANTGGTARQPVGIVLIANSRAAVIPEVDVGSGRVLNLHAGQGCDCPTEGMASDDDIVAVLGK